MAQTSGNEPRIAMRVNPEQKALIEQGAKVRGLSITDFMLTLALREAEIALTERTLFALNEEDYDHFMAVMDRPAQAKPELRHLIDKNRKTKWKTA
jgi:uncharacterized protein (DUF1778 family)